MNYRPLLLNSGVKKGENPSRKGGRSAKAPKLFRQQTAVDVTTLQSHRDCADDLDHECNQRKTVN